MKLLNPITLRWKLIELEHPLKGMLRILRLSFSADIYSDRIDFGLANDNLSKCG